MTFTRYSDVLAVLADPAFEVPPVASSGDAVDVAWLRATVSRFSTGPDHERRRALVEALLDDLDPDVLRAGAAQRSADAARRGASPTEIARTVPIAVLADALGITAPVSDDVRTVASGYQPSTEAGPAGDAAVAALVSACGGSADEMTAARIAVLVQACDATAGLIDNALAAYRRGDGGGERDMVPVDDVLAETLRHDPPVHAMRRVSVGPSVVGTAAVDVGTHVVLDLVAANRDAAAFADPDVFDAARPCAHAHLTFGAGLRPCPGRDQAIALAAGVLSAVLTPTLVPTEATS